ncbi:sigma factor-like helix-turn-helix DNA-binding protein [Demequina sp. NBRC 110053]|uniref:sigma factor-like helix-turn-helix DNA-binding protein n=1 Tax=Demequina sp. NBRC 110053 TaxID=1570342 RepID=UPI0009FFD3D6|nr:sigma factor-like helix-turn-helix DNA-binding protein [Demequina sp. NBRC 110053]
MARWQDLYQQAAHARYPALVAYTAALTGEEAEDAAARVDRALTQVFGTRRRLAGPDEGERAVRAAVMAAYLRAAGDAEPASAEPPRHHAAPDDAAFAPPSDVLALAAAPGPDASGTLRADEERRDSTPQPVQESAHERTPALASALSTLSPRVRAAVLLRCYDDLTIDQIAHRLSMPPRLASELLDRAAAALHVRGYALPDLIASDGSLETATVTVAAHGEGW